MHEVAADADALAIDLERRAIGAGLHVVEANVLVHEVANRLHARPARRRCGRTASRRGPSVRYRLRSSGWPADTAASRAADLAPSACVACGACRSGSPQSSTSASLRNDNSPRRRDDSPAAIAVQVVVLGHRQRRRDLQAIGLAGGQLARRMQIEHQQHRGGLRRLERNLVADFNQHSKLRSAAKVLRSLSGNSAAGWNNLRPNRIAAYFEFILCQSAAAVATLAGASKACPQTHVAFFTCSDRRQAGQNFFQWLTISPANGFATALGGGGNCERRRVSLRRTAHCG